MASSNAAPISGRERIRVIQGGWEVWLDRPMMTSLLAMTSVPNNPPRPFMAPTTILGTETFSAWQDGTKITMNAADLTTFLAGSGNAPDHPGPQPTTLMGNELIVGHQSVGRIAFSIAEVASIRAAAGGGGATVPAAPTFGVTPGNAQNSISWTDGSTGGSAITGHKLYRSTTSGFTPGAGNLIGTIATASPYVDSGLTNGTAYYYRLSAVNAIGESAIAAEQSGTPVSGGAAFSANQLSETNAPITQSFQPYRRTSKTGGGNGLGQTSVPLALNVTTPCTVKARVRDRTSNAIVQAKFTVATVSAGNTTVNAIVDARMGEQFLDLTGDDGATWTNGTIPFGVGETIVAAGQSLFSYMFTQNDTVTWASLGVIAPQFSRAFASYGGITSGHPLDLWPPLNGDGSAGTSAVGVGGMSWEIPDAAGHASSPGLAEWMRLAEVYTGVPHYVYGNIVGATPISAYSDPTQQCAIQLQNVITAVALGTPAHAFWYQGHNDTGSVASYSGRLDTVFASMNATGSTARYVGGIPDQTLISGYGNQLRFNPIRAVQETWTAANGAAFIQNANLKLNSDGIHETGAGSVELGRSFARAMRPVYGLPSNQLGPNMFGGTVSRVGAVITITPTMRTGATALAIVGTSSYNLRRKFRVYPTGTVANSYPLASVTVSGANIIITLNMDPGVGAALDIWYAYALPTSDTDYIVDNNVAGDTNASGGALNGRELMTTISTPLVVPAITGGGAINNPAHWDLEVGSAITYGTGKFGTGCLAGGYVNLPFAPYVAATTLDFWIKMATNPTGTWFLANRQAGLQMTSTGALSALWASSGATATTAAGAVPADGAWHHVRMCTTGVTGAGNVTIYVDGTLVGLGTGGTNTLALPGDFPIGIAAQPSGGNARTTGTWGIDEVAFFPTALTAGTVIGTNYFTPPTSAYVGNEGMTNLYHLDNNLLDSATH